VASLCSDRLAAAILTCIFEWDRLLLLCLVLDRNLHNFTYLRREKYINCKEIIINLLFMDPCIVDYSVEIPTRCSRVIEFIIPKFFKGSTCFERHIAHHQEL